MVAATTAVIEGAVALQLGMRRMRQLGDSSRPIFDAIGQYGESSTRLRFKKGIGPDGARWKPSARALASGGQTLVNKGAHGGLLGSITYRADNESAEWGTNKIYAAIHQFGGTIRPRAARNLRFRTAGGAFVSTKRVVMPARPFLGLNDEDHREIPQIVVDVVKAAEAGRMGGGFV
ncbi:phage virion morphogenesis protein [Variovorax sp. VNK109]|uniref:phage virion morphogenesis protein n=1 Tax=Variovorax sp. VNK109 TaxID=3400919 RepID=UPI003C0ACCB0